MGTHLTQNPWNLTPLDERRAGEWTNFYVTRVRREAFEQGVAVDLGGRASPRVGPSHFEVSAAGGRVVRG